MNSGSKPKPGLTMPPSTVVRHTTSVEDKLAGLSAAQDWANAPAVADATAAGVVTVPDLSQSSDDVVYPSSAEHLITIAKPMKALSRNREPARSVNHRLVLDPETNERLENLVDQIPRSSKAKLIALAIKEFVERTEKQIAKAKNESR